MPVQGSEKEGGGSQETIGGSGKRARGAPILLFTGSCKRNDPLPPCFNFLPQLLPIELDSPSNVPKHRIITLISPNLALFLFFCPLMHHPL